MSDERLAAGRPGRGVEDGLERDPPVRDLVGWKADPGGILAGRGPGGALAVGGRSRTHIPGCGKAFKAERYAEADAALRSLERLRPTAARARGDRYMWRPTGDQTTTGYDLGAQGVTIALAYLDRR
jgi:hypothetical protein